MDLIVQPAAGITPTVDAIKAAQKTLDLIIFRFDLKAVEKAIEAAVERGVAVRALIAHTNSGGEKRLRQLELRMLAKGVMVSRTNDELVRYHAKMMVVDREELHVYGFNYTALDLEKPQLRHRDEGPQGRAGGDAPVRGRRLPPGVRALLEEGFVVSPENAREQLATFIKRAKRSLAIYDPKLADPQMIRLIHQRAKAGVDVRLLGKVGKRGGEMRVQKLAGDRLHVRAMIRDGDTAFVGSQSLRGLELDLRREVGLIVRDSKVVKGMLDVFEQDWAKTDLGQKEIKQLEKAEADAELVAS